MAFDLKGLCLVSAAGIAGIAGSVETKRVFAYHTNDDAAAVQTANYFFDAAYPTRFRKGDIIMASMDVDATPVLKIYVVTVANPTATTLVLQTTT